MKKLCHAFNHNILQFQSRNYLFSFTILVKVSPILHPISEYGTVGIISPATTTKLDFTSSIPMILEKPIDLKASWEIFV